MSRITLCALSLSLCWVGSIAFGQGALTEVYGEGVHRFFAGDLVGAEELLSEVINSGSEDPRPYYFRGLVLAKQGLGGEVDFESGARMEAESRMAVDIGFSLSRIQGSVRGEIEKARRDARVVARQQSLQAERDRIEKHGSLPPPKPADPSAGVPSGNSAPADPFSGDEGMRGEATVDSVQPKAPEVDSLTNPFGDDPAPPAATPAAGTPATSNPFDSTPVPDAGNPFDTTPATPAPPSDNPFDTGGAPMDNPFE